MQKTKKGDIIELTKKAMERIRTKIKKQEVVQTSNGRPCIHVEDIKGTHWQKFRWLNEGEYIIIGKIAKKMKEIRSKKDA